MTLYTERTNERAAAARGSSQAEVQTRVKSSEGYFSNKEKKRERKKERGRLRRIVVEEKSSHLKFERKSLSPEAKSTAKGEGASGRGVWTCACE